MSALSTLEKPIISIVVPVYRVEKYLRKCVDSILAQTYEKLEIILVDDGSDDSCSDICDDYSLKDNRIKVFHKSNGGLSDARNYGTEHASGSFIMFIDSDDYIESDFIETIYNLLVSSGADIAAGGITNEWENGILNRYIGCQEDKYYDTKTAITEMCYGKNLSIYGWGKLIPREIAKNCLFPYGKLHEDVATTYKFILNSNTVAVSSTHGYHYVIREGSILNQKFNMKSCYAIEAAETLAHEVAMRFPDLKTATNARIAIECNGLLHRAAGSEYFHTIRILVLSKLKGRMLNILTNSNIQRKIRLQLALCKINEHLYLYIYNSIKHLRRNIFNSP